MYKKSCGCTTPELQKKPHFATQRRTESGFLLLSLSLSLCAKKCPALDGWKLDASQPGGASQWRRWEKHPSIAALSHVSSVKWSLCKALAGASSAPHQLSARPRQRAQGGAASGCCCFSHVCLSAPCRNPFSLEMLQHPFASWVPLGGLAMAWKDISPWALCLELGAVGHSATAPTGAQLLHPGRRALLFSEDKQLHCEYFLCKG